MRTESQWNRLSVGVNRPIAVSGLTRQICPRNFDLFQMLPCSFISIFFRVLTLHALSCGLDSGRTGSQAYDMAARCSFHDDAAVTDYFFPFQIELFVVGTWIFFLICT